MRKIDCKIIHRKNVYNKRGFECKNTTVCDNEPYRLLSPTVDRKDLVDSNCTHKSQSTGHTSCKGHSPAIPNHPPISTCCVEVVDPWACAKHATTTLAYSRLVPALRVEP